MSFTSLLIHTCTIQTKTLNTTGYEQIPSWSNESTNVPCRKDSNNGAKIDDGTGVRINKDDDIFFFDANVNIARGKRIVFGGENYDVIKVNKMYDSVGLHHLEVEARNIDHD